MNRKGFTITELIIGIGISSAIALVAIYAINSGGRLRKISQNQNELILEAQQVDMAIKHYLNEAVRVTGQTAASVTNPTGFSGIVNPATTPRDPASDDNDVIKVIAGYHNAINYPVAFNSTLSQFILVPPTSNSSVPNDFSPQDAFNFFKDVLLAQKAPYILVNNNRYTNLITVSGPPNSSASQLTLTPSSAPSVATEFTGSVNTISLAQIIKIEVCDPGSSNPDCPAGITRSTLIAIENPGAGTRILSHNVTEFQVNYTFRDFDAAGLALPTSPVNHINSSYTASNGITCPGNIKCLSDWKDVDTVQIYYSLEHPDTIKNAAALLDKDNSLNGHQKFVMEDGHMVYNHFLKVYPSNFSKNSATDVSDEVDPTCTDDINLHRCDAQCTNAFTSFHRADPNWIGYKPGSDYCACGTDTSGTFHPNFNSSPLPWAWSDSTGKNRLRSCFASMGCTYGSTFYSHWSTGNPEQFLACGCIAPGSPGIAYTIDPEVSDTQYGLYRITTTQPLVGSDGTAIINGKMDSAKMLCDWGQHNNPNTNFCDVAAAMANNGTYPFTDGTMDWDDYCGCKTDNANQLNLKDVCNMDYLTGASGSPKCSATMTGTRGNFTYKRSDLDPSDPRYDANGLPNAKTEQDCLCGGTPYNYSASGYRFANTTYNDFRDPTVTASITPPNSSAIAIPISGLISLGVGEGTGSTLDCAQHMCSSTAWNNSDPSCCVTDTPAWGTTMTLDQLKQNMIAWHSATGLTTPDPNDATVAKVKNYCNQACDDQAGAQAASVAQWLSGAPDTNPANLPTWCHGTQNANSSQFH